MSMNRLIRKPSEPTLSNAWREIFGAMVQERREAIHRSVEDSARLAGMEVSEWLAVEGGHIPADPVKLRSMAAALDIRFDQMVMMVHLCQGAWAE